MARTHHLHAVQNVPSSEPTFARPSGPADDELEWFFTMAESSMGLRSNFLDSLMIAEQRRDDSEGRFEAARAHRIILGRVRTLGDPAAGVLHVAYAARRWPLPLREELGRLTGILVRLGAAEVGLPDDDTELARLEEHVAGAFDEILRRGGPPDLARFRAEAQAHFNQAYGAYRRLRGGGPSLARRFA